MKFSAKKTNQKGAALAITVLVVAVLAVIIQSMIFLALSRSRIAGQIEDIYEAEHIAVNGLECGLSQAIFQQAFAGGKVDTCFDQAIVLENADFEDYDYRFQIDGNRLACATVYVRKNKTDDYTIRSVGSNLGCGNSFGARRVIRVMNVTQTDEGKVSRSLVSD